MATSVSNRHKRQRARRAADVPSVSFGYEGRDDGRVGLGETPQSALQYILEAMAPVDPRQTEIAHEACTRVQNQLGDALKKRGHEVDFERQGSVTTDTHIRVHSDIDLLALTKRFYFVKAPLQALPPYVGNPLADLLEIRTICESVLQETFPAAVVNIEGDKSVCISGGSLRRKVNVVPAGWVDTAEYRQCFDVIYRGVRILDKGAGSTIENFPFLHNARLNARDDAARGYLKRLIRLVKSIRSDSDEEICINSYDLSSLCFHFPLEWYDLDPALLLWRFNYFVAGLLRDDRAAQALFVPNGTRRVFETLDKAQLRSLTAEASSLVAVGQRAA